MSWNASHSSQGTNPEQGQWPNPARPPDASRLAPSSQRVGNLTFSSNISTHSPRSNVAHYPSQAEPAASTEMGLRAGRNPRVTALRAGGDIASDDGPSFSTMKYNLVLHKKVDAESKTRFDRLQEAMVDRVAIAVRECAERHEAAKQINRNSRYPDHDGPDPRKLSGYGRTNTNNFVADRVEDDPHYGTPVLVEAIIRAVVDQIRAMCEKASIAESDRCVELDGLVKHKERQVGVLEEIIRGKDEDIKELQAQVLEARETAATLAALPTKELVDRDTQSDEMVVVRPPTTITITTSANESDDQNNTALSSSSAAAAAERVDPPLFPLGENAAAGNGAGTRSVSCGGVTGILSVQQSLKLLKLSNTGEELAALPPSTMVEHLRVVRAYRERLEQMEWRAKEAMESTEEANTQAKSLHQQLREVGNELCSATLAPPLQYQGAGMRAIPEEEEGGESRENESDKWQEKQEAPTWEQQGATDDCGDGGENRSRSGSCNNDAAYSEGGVTSGGWIEGGYATDAPMPDDGDWAREPPLRPRPVVSRKSKVKGTRASSRKHADDDDDFWSPGNAPPASGNRSRGASRTAKTQVVRQHRAAPRGDDGFF